jgi:deazaflavin-dependent oxidoreductase (nitroreductase family)
MWYNPMLTALLRSPLHGLLSKNMLLITVTGRKSGRQYTTPVSYTRQGEQLWVISKRERTWWRNLIGGAPVSLLLEGKTVPARGEAVTDEGRVAARLSEHLSRYPRIARPLGVLMTDGRPDPQTLSAAAQNWLFVCIDLI